MATVTAPGPKAAPVYTEVLAPTRSCKHRGLTWCPGRAELVVTARRRQTYRLEEFRPGRGYGPGRAFRLTKGDGTAYCLFVGPGGCSCDCAGATYEASDKADRRHADGGFGTKGCAHLDAVAALLANGWLDRKADVVRAGDDDLPACLGFNRGGDA